VTLKNQALNPHQVHIVTTSPEPLALVFTDMVGSSAAKRADSLGQDATARDRAFLESIQTKHLKLIRDAIAEHKGTEIMTIGDSFFLTFEDVVDAVRCSAAIQQRLRAYPIDTPSGPLQLRIGIHIGRPEYFENSWHGTDVDTAARAESAGTPQQIVLTDAARAAAGQMTGIEFRPLGTFTLKGVGSVKLWDADYDQHGLRPACLTSIEARRKPCCWPAVRRQSCCWLCSGLREDTSGSGTSRGRRLRSTHRRRRRTPLFLRTLRTRPETRSSILR